VWLQGRKIIEVSRSRYRRAKMPPQNRRKSINFIFKIFLSAGYSFLRA
jgi:hypothetical protein